MFVEKKTHFENVFDSFTSKFNVKNKQTFHGFSLNINTCIVCP